MILRIDLNSPVTLAGARAGLGKFLAWWARELIAVLPASWQRRYQGLFRTPILIIEGKAWRLTNFNETGAAFPIDSNAPASELHADLLRLMDNGFANSIEVCLPKEDVLFRRLTLPAAAQSRLRSVVRLQLDRLSPFRGDDVRFDYRLVTADEESDIVVEIALIPKAILDQYEQKLREIGFVPRAFTIADSPLRFLPRGIPWTRQTQSQAFLALFAVAAWLAVFWFAPIAREGEIATLNTQIASLASEVKAAETERFELSKYQLPPMAITQDRQRALDALLEMTKLLPAGAHLTDFSLNDGVVSIRGDTPVGIDVRAIFTKSKLFEHVTFSQISDGPDDERFQATMVPRSASPHRDSENAL